MKSQLYQGTHIWGNFSTLISLSLLPYRLQEEQSLQLKFALSWERCPSGDVQAAVEEQLRHGEDSLVSEVDLVVKAKRGIYQGPRWPNLNFREWLLGWYLFDKASRYKSD